jgi:hypothetical protein
MEFEAEQPRPELEEGSMMEFEAEQPRPELEEGGMDEFEEADESELEEARRHVRELLGIVRHLTEAADSDDSADRLAEANDDIQELLDIAGSLASPQLIAGSGSEASDAVAEEADTDIAEMLQEMQSLQETVVRMRTDMESAERDEGELSEAHRGILNYKGGPSVLPRILPADTSRAYRDAGMDFIDVERHVNEALRRGEVDSLERAIMLRVLDMYREDIAAARVGAPVTSLSFLRRLDANVMAVVVALGG